MNTFRSDRNFLKD